MKILMTGATGFLGKHLQLALKSEGHEVKALGSKDADLKQQGSLNAFNSIKYDRIYHLAAWTQAGDFCLRHPGEQWVINQQMNTHVLGWWQQHQPQAKMIAIGTSCSYAPDLPMLEANYLLGEPIDSLYTYAHTKRMLLIGLMSLRKQFGLNYLYVVPSTLYGEGYHTDGRQMHFIFDLIRKILNGKHDGAKVELWGDGHQKRELIHVTDFISALTQLDRKVANEVVNIGAGEEHSIRHFAQLICDHVGYDAGKIFYDTSKYVGAKSKCLSIQKLQQMLPQYKGRPLKKGLETTIDWFAAHRDHFQN